MNGALPIYFIFGRLPTRDRWRAAKADPMPDGDGWQPFRMLGEVATIGEARLLIPNLASRTFLWSSKDPGRCTREIWQ